MWYSGWIVERGRAAMAAFPTVKPSILCQVEPEGTGWGRVDPRRKAHRNSRCLFEGQIKKVPDTPKYDPEEADLERGRAAMAAFPNQENGVASECKKDLKGGRTAMAAPRSSWWTGRRGE